jgi:hypothetical protein
LQAGLLARPVFFLTPSHLAFNETVAGVCQKPFYGLTATGIAPDLHGIPFSSSAGNRKKKPAKVRGKGKACLEILGGNFRKFFFRQLKPYSSVLFLKKYSFTGHISTA